MSTEFLKLNLQVDWYGWLHHDYGKYSKSLSTHLFPFLKKILFIKAVINKMLVRIANREDPDQTASSEAAWYGSALLPRPFCQATSVRNFRTSTVSKIPF